MKYFKENIKKLKELDKQILRLEKVLPTLDENADILERLTNSYIFKNKDSNRNKLYFIHSVTFKIEVVYGTKKSILKYFNNDQKLVENFDLYVAEFIFDKQSEYRIILKEDKAFPLINLHDSTGIISLDSHNK